MGLGDQSIVENMFWGRRNYVSQFAGFKTASVLISAPSFVLFLSASLKFFDGSISQSLQEVWTDGLKSFVSGYFPQPSIKGFLAYGSWFAFQALLYSILPGKIYDGQPTPGGHVLRYSINGLLSFFVTIAVALWAGQGGFVDPAWVARNWQHLLIGANLFGVALSSFMYLKASVAPSKPRDTRFSGSFIHDFFAGCELNPRWGENWDIKLFHVGRPGMNAWVVVDLSFAAMQYQDYGHISNSMMIAIFFHVIYVIDFFYNEDWYLKTIDIHHDHFGFYLSWGCAVWLPMIYTIQAQYLASHPIQLSTIGAALTLTIGLGGYTLFRCANHQKYLARKTNGKCQIWGSKAEVMKCSYKTSDGGHYQHFILAAIEINLRSQGGGAVHTRFPGLWIAEK
ncbi:7-dehydrocholesterol reductase [Arachnomyces sp. PD_36]|nr:7-dehydrocholesterol reductase [Arachnomyces sp. PD_36]